MAPGVTNSFGIMRNFIRFIIRYHFLFLFLLFETFCFYLLINYNHRHQETFINSSGKVVASFLEISGTFKDYVSLRRANEELSRENALLRTQIPENIPSISEPKLARQESDDLFIYQYRAGKVINNSVHRAHNFITINKGSKHGIAPEMGVISARGLVGIVRHVSPNYSTAISLLNNQFRVSAKLRDSNYFGVLEWDGKSYQHAILTEIPGHAPVSTGDAIVTSGYSTIFPEGILIGTIEDYQLHQGEGFYEIRVKLSVDFKNLTYVEVVEKTSGEEQKQLENLMQND